MKALNSIYGRGINKLLSEGVIFATGDSPTVYRYSSRHVAENRSSSVIRIYMPHQNLGCLGIGIGDFYADLSRSWGGNWHIYVNWFKKAKYTIGFWFVRKWRG